MDEIELLGLLKNTQVEKISNDLLRSIVTSEHPYSDTVLLAVALHVQSTSNTIDAIIKHKNCSPQLIQDYLNGKKRILRQSNLKITLHGITLST